MLPDGRRIRAPEGVFNQKAIFGLRRSGLYAPEAETIMSPKDHDLSFQSDSESHIRANGDWRTGDYAFYPKGFERRLMSIGSSITYSEYGISYTLQIPDVPVRLANGETVCLRAATGMGVIRVERLVLTDLDEKKCSVSVSGDFDPAKDLFVVDVMRPGGWGIPDARGYPLRTRPSHEGAIDAKCMVLAREKTHLTSGLLDGDSTGWHGSVAVALQASRAGHREDATRFVFAGHMWCTEAGVALVSQDTK